MSRTHDVHLLPGSFGFANLRRITCFGRVRRLLTWRFSALGVEARIHLVRAATTADARSPPSVLLSHARAG